MVGEQSQPGWAGRNDRRLRFGPTLVILGLVFVVDVWLMEGLGGGVLSIVVGAGPTGLVHLQDRRRLCALLRAAGQERSGGRGLEG
jgi:hypothetical protein